MSNWYTPLASKVVYAPIWADGADKAVDDPARFIPNSVRVDLLDGTHWTFNFRYKTWTHHWYGPKARLWEGTKCGLYTHKPVRVEYTKSYTFRALRREYKGRELLIMALLEAHDAAIAADEAKRAA